MKQDYNIEFAHIYADKLFGKEQEKSIVILKEVLKNIKNKKKTWTAGILIDEFSPQEIILNEKEFLRKILSYKVPIDFVAHESELTKVSDKVIKTLPKPSLKIEKFDNRKVLLLVNKGRKIGLKDLSGRPTCALLIAAWTLCRLGIYRVPKLDKRSKKPFEAKKLITILPGRYRESESKVIEILKSSKYNDVVKKIEYRFFK